MEEVERSVRSRGRFLLPVFVLMCGLAATALATYLIRENHHFKDRQRLQEAGTQIERTISARMEGYVGLLRGGAGLFASNPFVTREQFRRFYERLEIEKHYPGLQGFGYSVRFPPEKLDALVATNRQQGLTNFMVWPPGPRLEYHAIVFLEPRDQRNQRAIGYDMFTEAHRRAAMQEACDNGNPWFTRKVRLVQEYQNDAGQPGFLIYLPVFLGGSIPPTTEGRRSLLQGFVYSPFRAGDIFRGMFPNQAFPRIAFSIWDGTEATPEALLYQSDPDFRLAAAGDLKRLEVPGAVWTLGVGQLTGSVAGQSERRLWIVPLLGVLASILLSYFTYTEGKARTRTEQAANELFNQREWLQVTLASIGDGVISTDTAGCVQFMNRVAERLTGWTYREAQQKQLRDVFRITNEQSGEPAENPAEQVLATGNTVNLSDHTLLTDKNGIERCIDDSAAPIRDRAGAVIGVVLVFREITERRRYERRSAAQNAVTSILAESPSLSEAAARVIESVCGHLKFDVGVAWLFDKNSETARVSSIWHAPDAKFDVFDQACLNFKPKRGEGLPGMVWVSRKPMWVTEFLNDARFSSAADARALGLNTAFAFPVDIEANIYGALEFFSREHVSQDAELLDVAEGIGKQIGLFIQRKHAENALAESEEIYRAISETAADGIVVIDGDSRILTVNTAVERIFGFAKHELIGQSLKMLIPARMHAGHDQGMKRFLHTGQKRISWNGVELPGQHKNGLEFPLEISFGVARRGSAYLFTGLIRDITRRKEAERRLRETEERFGLLVRLAEEYAIITKDPDGKISTWNPGAQRIFGYSDEEVVGRDIEIFFTNDDQAAQVPARQMEKARSEGQVLDERWQVRKDGSRFWASGLLVCLRSEDGTVRGFAKILRDITERKNAEEAIRELNQELETRVQRRTAALQESKEQMEAFSYTVAHDLRAPLRGMQGFAHALVDEYGARLDRSAVDYLQRIMSSAQRMDELIQDLLGYSQLSRSDLSFNPVAVKDIVENALLRHEEEIRRTGTEVRTSLDPLFVRAHAATLENAVGNLIANGIKFTRPGETPKLHIRVINQGANVQISVQDNGIGVAPEHHDRIFRVFERLHAEDAYPGTGIGLAIVKKGVERMGGKVGLASEPGQGSLFWIELPRENAQS